MLTKKQYDIVAVLVLLLLVIVWLALVAVLNYEPPCDCITDIECEVTLCSHLGE